MADIPITTGTGSASVATELVGARNFQIIEVVGGGGASTLAVNPDGSLRASIWGTPAVTFSGSPSISGAVTIVGTPSISGAVTVVGTPSISGAVTVVGTPSISGTVNVSGLQGASVSGAIQIYGNSSIATVHIVDDQIISSMVALVTDTIIHGRTTAGGGGYVEVKVDPSGAMVVANASVVSYQFPASVLLANVAGSVVAFQGGTQITSIVNTVPSSVIVGVSVFGQLPSGTATLGSVATLQGTNPWVTIIPGSVIAVNQGSVASSDTITSIATANGGLPIWSPLGSRIQGTADLRVVQGASVAVIAAQGAGVRTYIDHVQVLNFGSSSVLVTIADNTTSILGYTIAPAGGGSNYDTFYRPAANSPITASINGTASVLVSMQGFTSGT